MHDDVTGPLVNSADVVVAGTENADICAPGSLDAAKVAGKIALVMRTCVSSSVIGRSAVSCSPHGLGSKEISGWWNSRMIRVIGHFSPPKSPALALRNWRPAAFSPTASSAASPRNSRRSL